MSLGFFLSLAALLVSPPLNSWLLRGSHSSPLSNPSAKRASFRKSSRKVLEDTLFSSTISLACLMPGVEGRNDGRGSG